MTDDTVMAFLQYNTISFSVGENQTIIAQALESF